MSAKFVKTLLSIQTIPQGYVPSPGSIRVFSSANKKSLLKKSRLLWFRLSYANVSSAHSAAVFRIISITDEQRWQLVHRGCLEQRQIQLLDLLQEF